LFDFGIAVHVDAPPVDAVADMTDAYVALVSGPGNTPAAAWRRAASGTVRGQPWAVWFAETSTHWHCYDVDIPDGARGGIDVATKDPVRHDGRAAWCPSPGPGPVTFTLALSDVDGGDFVLVGITNGGPRPVLMFADGASTPLTLDTTTGVTQWRGPVSPKPVRVKYGAESCALDPAAVNARAC
jgi:hypothetical protein